MTEGVARLRALRDAGRSLVMGVLNVTPDSFSDGGDYLDADAAVARAEELVAAGADIVDIGGESTRPGAEPVDLAEERRRVMPVLRALSQRLRAPVSVDTSKPELMAEAVATGAAMINDVRALSAPGAIDALVATPAQVCLMHMQGEPPTMQDDPRYADVVAEVGDYLGRRVDACTRAGIDAGRLWIDPGFGFGKTFEHNLELLRGLQRLRDRLGCPVVAGVSRKRMIATMLGDVPAGERVHGSVAAAVIAAQRGARILRVHDVRATRDALAVVTAVEGRS